MTLLMAHDTLCDTLIGICLRLALACDSYRRHVRKGALRLRGSLHRLYRGWRLSRDRPRCPPRARPAHNRTPAHVEESVVRLHVEQPQLGTGGLMRLSERVLGFRAARETFRQILIRRRDLVVEMEQECRRRPRRMDVQRPGQLWGVDLTLVWVLGFWPVWVLGAVDYFGSRLVAFERVAWPTASEVVRVLDATIQAHGAPARVLTDRGAVFTSEAFASMCAGHQVRHALIRPAHPWTNGRIERVVRTFKETVSGCIWMFAGTRQVDRYCHDFRLWHDRDRPHARWGGRTPDEVYFGRRKQLRPLGRVEYFDGRLRWWRFGPEG
jgi:transposase InsO family protein